MRIIKERLKDGNHFVIRTNTYAKSFQHIQMLVGNAREDFPDLRDEEITIVLFSGERYKGTIGIEFARQNAGHVEGYTETHKLELTF